MLNFLRNLYKVYLSTPDPMKKCSAYKVTGCSHVDGLLCDMTTCSTLKEHDVCNALWELDHK